ncbi:arylamine N-acetyltransferase family protein [Gordonia insulae]|uniref:Arylamine N-acetyltransferase n=1 Tax=Gordonia insulae TaxID=2420509 RepID=A0A3G8JHX7_9ACTN|nr:arylamine N-acetyltransferase [Gordonia insulae]AZG44696.1 Arylamine N-acetyltransferase [Gordonia insulae]
MSTTTGFDVDAYFQRIGYSGAVAPTLDTLTALVAAHVRHIPFENLDPLTGTPVDRLDPESLQDKLVRRRRGGFCYEQNGLFRYALRALGYGVEPLAGRVVWMRPPGPLPAETHQLLSVAVPDEPGRLLVDVGFGGQTPTAPLHFTIGEEQPTDLEPFRIVATDDERLLRMESRIGGEWRPLYLFSPNPRPEIDSVVGSWFASTHTGSHFRSRLTACAIVGDARWNLGGRTLTIHSAQGATDKRRLADADEVLDLLAGGFGIDLTGIEGLGDRVGEVLDN